MESGKRENLSEEGTGKRERDWVSEERDRAEAGGTTTCMGKDVQFIFSI